MEGTEDVQGNWDRSPSQRDNGTELDGLYSQRIPDIARRSTGTTAMEHL